MARDIPPDDRVRPTDRFEPSRPIAKLLRRLAVVHTRWPDLVWLTLVLLVGTLVAVTYLVTHPYPAYGAGLYLEISEQILASGYGLPKRIPGYTETGVPFAYPPLQFYLAALVRDVTGIAPLTYARYLPAVLTVLYLVPYYAVARELLGSRRRAAIGTVLFAVTPPVLQWHLSAGGIVRAMAMLWVLAGTYAGLKVFRDDDRRWLGPAVALFGLTVLTHPTYTVFFGLTYLLLVARFDRTISGVLTGAVVASGGLLLAAPWWFQVAQHHGPDIFFAAAGTHSGLGGGPGRFVTEFAYQLAPDAETVFFAVVYIGAIFELRRRRWFLPAWLFVAGYVVGKPRFQFVAGSLLSTIFVADVVVPKVQRLFPTNRRWLARAVLVTVLVVGTVGIGTAFSASALQTHDGGSTMPAFIDSEDAAAMEWVQRNTAPSSSFVVLGDAAEWFPLQTDRTILVGPWGVEWTTPERYQSQLSRFISVSTCDTETCLSTQLDRGDHDPDYVYIPKGHYTVRGDSYRQTGELRSAVLDADEYERVYETDGVLIVRRVSR